MIRKLIGPWKVSVEEDFKAYSHEVRMGSSELLEFADSMQDVISGMKLNLLAAKTPEIEVASINPEGYFSMKVLVGSDWISVDAKSSDFPSKILSTITNSTNENRKKKFLKIRLRDEYLMKEKPICQYSYIQKCIFHAKEPLLELVSEPVWPSAMIKPSIIRRKDKKRDIQLPNESLQVAVTKLPGKGIVKIALYHGTEYFDSVEVTKRLNRRAKFPVNIYDIPRSAMLCITICQSTSIFRRGDKTTAWCNFPLFDHEGTFAYGSYKLFLHPMTKDISLDEKGFYPLGTTNQGLETEDNCQRLTIRFPEEYEKLTWTSSKLPQTENPFLLEYQDIEVNENLQQMLRTNLEEICNEIKKSESLKKYIWTHRFSIARIDNGRTLALPAILLSVNWWNRQSVQEVYAMLQYWPYQVTSFTALLLLDYRFPDNIVRRKAVEIISSHTGKELFQFVLPQLVNSAKFELFDNSALIRLLVVQCMLDHHVANRTYWLLRSEHKCLHEREYNDRFTLISFIMHQFMPADFVSELERQENAMAVILKIGIELKETEQPKKVDSNAHLRQLLESFRYDLRYFRNPMRPSICLGNLMIDDCHVFDSNAKPFKLVWQNANVTSNIEDDDVDAHPGFIFKIGDDLNQEQLALQMIELFAGIWQSQQMDLPLVYYRVLTLEPRTGLIEIVPNAKTVLKAIRETKKGISIAKPFTFISEGESIRNWLKDTVSPQMYDNAVSLFIRSCAGYCVASDILGLGDRHPSNILICPSGLMIHIDFAYMFGDHVSAGIINRERTPVVLITDFFDVIQSCGDDAVEGFYSACDHAFTAVRYHFNELCTLCLLLIDSKMINSLPSLSSICHVWQKSLCMDQTEEQARIAFYQRLKKSKDRSILRKIDWEFHAAAHPE